MEAANHEILHPTHETFESEVMESSVPVLVDFWAPWCPPCRALKPAVEELSRQLTGRAKVAFINVDEQPELAERYGVQSIPALMIVKDGDVVDSFVGLVPGAELRRRVEAVLN